jgi:hypothetical protein
MYTNPKTYELAIKKYVLNRKEDFDHLILSKTKFSFHLRDKDLLLLNILPKKNELLKYKLYY